MTEIISVRFSNRGKAYFFDPVGMVINKGDNVVVETSKGLEYGECTYGNRMVNDDSVVRPLRPVVRIATEIDRVNALAWKEREKTAFEYCQKRILDFGLDMKLVDVEYGFEGNKVLFFFTSDGRVDFRELVKDLAAEFRARIELRQIGVRDEAKMLGGLGVCGKQFCCSQFLSEFHPVSIKMAKTQGLSLNPSKISGTCGRLMCCLKYEDAAYEDLVKKAPKLDAFVDTPTGKGTVINVNLLRGNAKVRMEDVVDTTLKIYSFEELEILGGKGRRAEYIAAKAEGRLEEAGFKVTPPPQQRPISTPSSFSSGNSSFTSSGSGASNGNANASRSGNQSNSSDASSRRQPARSNERSNDRDAAADARKRQASAPSEFTSTDEDDTTVRTTRHQSTTNSQNRSTNTRRNYSRNRNNRNNNRGNNRNGQNRPKQ